MDHDVPAPAIVTGRDGARNGCLQHILWIHGQCLDGELYCFAEGLRRLLSLARVVEGIAQVAPCHILLGTEG